MRKTLCVLLLLELVFSSVAADASSPKNIGESKVFLQLNWSIDFGEGGLPRLFSFKTFGFPTTAVQKSHMEAAGEHKYVEKTDSLGNLLLEYSIEPSSKTELVSLRALVDANYAASQPAGAERGKFLEESSLTAASPEMRGKAKELRGKAKNDLHALVLLTQWVHDRVRYDGPGYGSNVQTAEWVFANQVGTCDEYSHLLASMLRSLGIPSKFSAGFVCSVNCTSSENWGPHAWVEALIGDEWFSADPTFNEAILLDATHIKFAEARDQNDVKETLSTLASDYAISSVKIVRSAQVSLDEWKPFKVVSLEVKAPEEPLGEGAVARVVAKVSSNADRPAAVPLSVTVPPEATLLEKGSELVFIEPGETLEREWKVVLPQKLERGFLYAFPVKVSSLAAEAEAVIEARKEGAQKEEESLRVVDLLPRLRQDGVVELEVSFLNTGNKEIRGAKVFVETTAGNATASVSLRIAGTTKATFALNPLGAERVSGRIIVKTSTFETLQPIEIALPRKAASKPASEADGQESNAVRDFLNSLLAAILAFFGIK